MPFSLDYSNARYKIKATTCWEKMMQRDVETFLKTNRIKPEDWQSSNIEWGELLLIGEDHESQRATLEGTASYYANLIQRFSAVHSVRWRVKDTDHLLEKIIRKRAKATDKYLDISVANYAEIVDDLIGIRAIHLFKSDCFEIDAAVRATFELKDQPVAYVRDGDNVELKKQYKEAGFVVEEHPHNYRSIHYILSMRPTTRVINIELQVRTIFEEGWSEIDHKVRYPNFPNDPQLTYLLGIFNGMAGNADEIGGFILTLASALQNTKIELEEAVRIRDERIAKIEHALERVAGEKSEMGGAEVATARTELRKLREDSFQKQATDIGGDIANWMATYTFRGIETSILHQQLRQIEEFNTTDAVKKSMEELDAVSKAAKGARHLASIEVARKAIEDQREASKAISDPKQLGFVDAAKKAMDEQDAISKAIKGFAPIDAAKKAMDEQDAISKAIKGFAPIDAAKKAMDEQDSISKAIKGLRPPLS